MGPLNRWSYQPMVLLSWKDIYIIIEMEWLAFRVEMFKMREALIKIAIHFDIITRLLNLKQVLFSCSSSRACFDSLNPSIYQGSIYTILPKVLVHQLLMKGLTLDISMSTNLNLHLKSHQRCSAGIRTWLSADSQVLPHWRNHHFCFILVLYTETLLC